MLNLPEKVRTRTIKLAEKGRREVVDVSFLRIPATAESPDALRLMFFSKGQKAESTKKLYPL